MMTGRSNPPRLAPRWRARQALLASVKRAFRNSAWQKAETACRSFLADDPGFHPAAFALALALAAGGDLAAAAAIARERLDDGCDARELADLLAVIHGRAGDLHGAAYYGKIAAASSRSPTMAWLRPRHFPDLSAVLAAIVERPFLERAVRLLVAGCLEEGEALLRQHLAFMPADREAAVTLASSLLLRGSYRAAINEIRAARHVLPDDPELASLLGRALAATGDFSQAGACHASACDLAPDDPLISSAALIDAAADPDVNALDLSRRFRSWGERQLPRYNQLLTSGSQIAPCRAHPAPLTIGYLVGRIGCCGEAAAVADVLIHRTCARFTTVGFGCGVLGDAHNGIFQTCFDRWQDIADADPLTLAAMVRAEGVDIVVDLAGFSAPEYLAALALRMAPCQVGWLNLPHVPGLAAMDFVLTDCILDPPGATGVASAVRPVLLESGSVVTIPFATPVHDAPVAPTDECILAADATMAELNPATVALWARVLHRLPAATLLLRHHPTWTDDDVQRIIELCGSFGISHRVDLVDESDPVAFFAQAQVGLLPLPAPRPAVISTMLAAGIPPVCLAGTGRHQRFAGSLLFHLGLADETVAADADAYVGRAAWWAASPDERQAFHRTLADPRTGVATRLNPKQRMADLEAAYRRMWQDHVADAAMDAANRKAVCA